MVQLAATLLRGVIATFLGLLIAGGTLTFAADRAAVQHPSLVPVSPPGPTTLEIPDVTGQAYVFAKGILQDRGFAWRVSGQVQGFAANTVATQQPPAGTSVLDTGAPLVVLTLQRNASYIERGSPDNASPYPGTTIKLPARVPTKPTPAAARRTEPVQVPYPASPAAAAPVAVTPRSRRPVTPAVSAPVRVPTPAVTPVTVPSPANSPVEKPKPYTPAVTPVTPTVTPVTTPRPAVTPVATPAVTPVATPNLPRTPDFTVPGAPKEPARSLSLPDRVAALASFVEANRSPSSAKLNHWLYEHAYVVAGARFGWWHGAQALQALITVDRRAEALWGVGSQSRLTAEKALAEIRAKHA
jgi:hypothetical protein